ncbi:bifunctional 5,10-methylenetetrahydrofolate dehydrogenase/5,10-methenyltetrahydrofolate cyclohydrolase [bacterium]|nr:bifunctional 5,10-methylenetetrahydrofolate dehydrogenase/5,10-methenyltetrahydrofolate cyclohydrolase [bacterium]
MGRALLAEPIIKKELLPHWQKFRASADCSPELLIFHSPHPSAEAFLKSKRKRAKEAGIKIRALPYSSATKKEILRANKTPRITGIVLQLPLPSTKEEELLYLVEPLKDVDGFFSKFFVPPVVKAVLRFLEEIPDWRKKRILVAGQGPFVGQEILRFLQRENEKVQGVENASALRALLPKTEILISCVGKPNLVKAKEIAHLEAIIDVGFCRLNGKVCGDVPEEIKAKLPFFTPVPGGVGPLTVAYLMENVWDAFWRQRGIIHSY